MKHEKETIKFIALWSLLCQVYIKWDEGGDGTNSDEIVLVTGQIQMFVWGLKNTVYL